MFNHYPQYGPVIKRENDAICSGIGTTEAAWKFHPVLHCMLTEQDADGKKIGERKEKVHA